MIEVADNCNMQIEIVRRMSAAQKIDAMLRLYYTARELKAAGLRMQHPSWPDEQIEREVRRVFLYGHD